MCDELITVDRNYLYLPAACCPLPLAYMHTLLNDDDHIEQTHWRHWCWSQAVMYSCHSCGRTVWEWNVFLYWI